MVLNEIINEMIQETACKGSDRQMKCLGYIDLVSEYKEQEISFQKTKDAFFCHSICLT